MPAAKGRSRTPLGPKMPFTVATYVYASSQGQRTHSARTKIAEKKDKKEHKAHNLNHFMSLIKTELFKVNKNLNITKNQVTKLRSKKNNTSLKQPPFCFYCCTYQESTVHYCEKQECFVNYDRFNKMVVKAELEEAAERKPGYQNHDDWIDLVIYKNPLEMDVSQ